VIQIAIG